MAEELGPIPPRTPSSCAERGSSQPVAGVPLANRTPSVLECLRQLGELVQTARITRLWEETVSAVPWSGRPVWLHGDLHPGNLVVRGNRLAAVIDFGDLTAGDPATDLSVAWSALPPEVRPTFRAAARQRIRSHRRCDVGTCSRLGTHAWTCWHREFPRRPATGGTVIRRLQAVLDDDSIAQSR